MTTAQLARQESDTVDAHESLELAHGAPTATDEPDEEAAASFVTSWKNADDAAFWAALSGVLAVMAVLIPAVLEPIKAQEEFATELLYMAATIFGSMSLHFAYQWGSGPSYETDGNGVTVRRRWWSTDYLRWDEVKNVRVPQSSEANPKHIRVQMLAARAGLTRRGATIDTSKFEDPWEIRNFIYEHLPVHLQQRSDVKKYLRYNAARFASAHVAAALTD